MSKGDSKAREDPTDKKRTQNLLTCSSLMPADTSERKSKPKQVREAAQVVELLKRKLVFFSGGLDNRDGAIISIPVLPDDPDISIDDLRDVFCYVSSLPSDKLQTKGLTFLIDGRESGSKKLKRIALALQAALECSTFTVHKVFIVRSDSFLDRHKPLDLKKENIHADFQIQYLTKTKLNKCINPSQLTEEFGGNYPYSHTQWLHKRLAVEKYVKECTAASRHLESCYHILTHKLKSYNRGNAVETLTSASEFYATNNIAPESVLNIGDELLIELETDTETGFKVGTNDGHENAVFQVKQAMGYLKIQQKRLTRLWHSSEQYLKDMIEILDIGEGINEVKSWIADKGDEKVSRQDIGSSYHQAVSLKKEHQQLELDCMDIYAKYAELCHKVDNLLKRGHILDKEILEEKEKMDLVCQNFALSMDQRQNLLALSVCFHSHLLQLYKTTSRVKLQLQHMKTVETLQDAQLSLQWIQESHTSIVDMMERIVKHGKLLLNQLKDNGFKQKGRVFYNKQLSHVHQQINHADQEKDDILKSLEVKRLRLQRELQVLQIEHDSKQSVRWLEELCEMMAYDHKQLGSTVEEVEQNRAEHQKFEDTAKSSYEYGCKLLETALNQRKSLKLCLLPNSQIANQIIGTWHKFLFGSQERNDRLKKCRSMYLNHDKIMTQLDLLQRSVNEDLRIMGEIRKKWIIRRHKEQWFMAVQNVQTVYETGENLLKRMEEPVIEGIRPLIPVQDAPSSSNSKEYERDESAAEKIEEILRQIRQKFSEMETNYFTDEYLSSSEGPSYATAQDASTEESGEPSPDLFLRIASPFAHFMGLPETNE